MVKPICPHCRVDLERRSNVGIFQYHCTQCQGFNLPMGSLKKALSADEIQKIWNLEKTAPKSKLACSHCRQPMLIIVAGQKSSEIDVCFRCHLVWLETGELTAVHAKPEQKNEQESKVEYGRLLLQMEQEKESFLSGLTLERTSLDKKDSLKYLVSLLGIPVTDSDDSVLSNPWLTRTLIVVTTLLSLWGLKNREWAFDHLSFSTSLHWLAILPRVFTASFLHAHLLHLIINMYVLWLFGENTEDHIGKKKFILLYILSTLMGFLLYSFTPHSNLPVVGASAGISGICAYYMYAFPQRRFIVFWFLRWFTVPGLLLGIFYLFYIILAALAEISTHQQGISHLGHLGGALVGLFLGWYWSPRREMSR